MESKWSTPPGHPGGYDAFGARQRSSGVLEGVEASEMIVDVESPPFPEPVDSGHGHGEFPSSRKETPMAEVISGMYLSVMAGYDIVGNVGDQLEPFVPGEEELWCSTLIVNRAVSFALKQDDHCSTEWIRGSLVTLGEDFSVDFQVGRSGLLAIRNWLKRNSSLELVHPCVASCSSSMWKAEYVVETSRYSSTLLSSQAGSSFLLSAELIFLGAELTLYVPSVEKGNSQATYEGARVGVACRDRLLKRQPLGRVPKHYVVSFNNNVGVLAPTEDDIIMYEWEDHVLMVLGALTLPELARGAGRKFLMSTCVLNCIEQISASSVTRSLNCSDLKLVLALCAFWEGDVGVDQVCDLGSLVDGDEFGSVTGDRHWKVLHGVRFLMVCARSMVNGKCGRLEISNGADISSNLSATELLDPSCLQTDGTKRVSIRAERLRQFWGHLSPLLDALTDGLNLEIRESVTAASLDIGVVYAVLDSLTGVKRQASLENAPVGVIVGKAETKEAGAPGVATAVKRALRGTWHEGGPKPHLRFVVSQVDHRRFRNIRASDDVLHLGHASGEHLGVDVEKTVGEYSAKDFYVGLSAVVGVTALGALLSTGVFHFLYALVLGAVLGEETDGFLFVAGVAPCVLSKWRVPSGVWLRATYIVMLGSVEAWAELEWPWFFWVVVAVGFASAGILILCRIGQSRLVSWGSGCPMQADYFRGRAGGPTPGVGRGAVFAGTRCGDGSDRCIAPYAAGKSTSDRVACEHAPAVKEPFDLYGWRLFGNATEARAFGSDK